MNLNNKNLTNLPYDAKYGVIDSNSNIRVMHILTS